MRILLDESLPRPLARLLPGHEVRTVAQMGWSGTRNGPLLALAAADSGCRDEVGSIGKAAQKSTARLPVDLREALWTSLDLREADIGGAKEVRPQPERAELVPQRRLPRCLPRRLAER